MISTESVGAPLYADGASQHRYTRESGESNTVASDGGIYADDGVYSPTEIATKQRASVSATVVNMVCNVIGGGVLALPSAFHDTSLVLGLVLLFCCATLTGMNLLFIVESADAVRVYSYRLLLLRGLGRRLAFAVDVVLFLYPISVLITFSRVVADAMPPVMANMLGAEGFWLNANGWFLISGLLFFLLSCRRSLEELKISSFIGIATLIFAGVAIVWRFADGKYNQHHTPWGVDSTLVPLHWSTATFRAIPILAIVVCVHANAASFYEELKDRTPARMVRVINWTHLIVLFTYSTFAVVGLLTFGTRIRNATGNVLNAYAADDQLMNGARLSMALHVACAYPLLLVAARRGFNNLVFRSNDLPFWGIAAETFGIVVTSSLVAAAVPNIDIIMSYNGSISGATITMIAPALLYLKTAVPRARAEVELAVSGDGAAATLPRRVYWLRMIAIFSIGCGIVAAVMGAASQTAALIEGDS